MVKYDSDKEITGNDELFQTPTLSVKLSLGMAIFERYFVYFERIAEASLPNISYAQELDQMESLANRLTAPMDRHVLACSNHFCGQILEVPAQFPKEILEFYNFKKDYLIRRKFKSSFIFDNFHALP